MTDAQKIKDLALELAELSADRDNTFGFLAYLDCKDRLFAEIDELFTLAAQPRREPVRLTQEQRLKLWDEWRGPGGRLIDDIEAAMLKANGMEP